MLMPRNFRSAFHYFFSYWLETKFLPTAYVVRWEVMFSQVSVRGGGEYPGQVSVPDVGYHNPVLIGGTPIQFRVGKVVPHQVPMMRGEYGERVLPSSSNGGTLSSPGRGYPDQDSPVMSQPQPKLDGVPPLGTVLLGQVTPRSVHLLRFPPGGLSCS